MEVSGNLLPLRGELLLQGLDLLEGAITLLLDGGVRGELQIGLALLKLLFHSGDDLLYERLDLFWRVLGDLRAFFHQRGLAQSEIATRLFAHLRF